MSLFRKPKKIQRRVFCADDDEDGDPEPPSPPVISQNKKENKPIKSTALLSFVDEGKTSVYSFKLILKKNNLNVYLSVENEYNDLK